MSLESFNDRNIENRAGRTYVDGQCLDCDLCRETAPTVFARQDSEGYSYVAKQPETPEEFAQVAESLEGCCTQAIHDDGDEFDWDRELQLPSRPKNTPRGKCSCAHSDFGDEAKPNSIGGTIIKSLARWIRRE